MAALGIVYGDLGTSPLHNYQAIVGAVVGRQRGWQLSRVVWALIITVSVKYCALVLRADLNGVGGILALMALVTSRSKRGAGVLVVMLGAALIYGDGIITPAISVLSALEGFDVATPIFKPYGPEVEQSNRG